MLKLLFVSNTSWSKLTTVKVVLENVCAELIVALNAGALAAICCPKVTFSAELIVIAVASAEFDTP